jgi:hypothetical protein
MPVMEYYAKNLGIRKSSRKYILMINADCLIGNDTVQQLKHLNKNFVYGTHYVSFKWDEKPITPATLQDKHSVVVAFSAPKDLSPVVGNFILTARENWLQATGYDERLNNVRAGVDTNGLRQLLLLRLQPMVLGHHFHLDHEESIIHGANQTHGSHAFNNLPYRNKDDWGFNNYPVKQIEENVWQLEEI